MANYRFVQDVAAPPELVFDLWTNVGRMGEWIGGVTKVTDVTGPLAVKGTRYTVWFGRMKSPSEVIEVERPRLFRNRFGNRLLRGQTQVTFEATATGTRLTQDFRTEGVVPAIAAWLWSRGSYRGSFRGELAEFARIAEREARSSS